MEKVKKFMSGWATIFNFHPRIQPDFSGGFERDARMLRGDWEKVGGSIRFAMDCAGKVDGNG